MLLPLCLLPFLHQTQSYCQSAGVVFNMNSFLISVIIALLGIKGNYLLNLFLSAQCCKFHDRIWFNVSIFSTGASPNQNENVHQTPTDLLKNITDGDKLTCKHKVKSYDTIVWYHRPAGDTSLKLVGFTSYKEIQTVEKPYEGLFSVSGNGEVEAFLHLGKLRHPENSGHYFCAVSSPTTAEKPEIPLQKPSSDPEHLQQTTCPQTFADSGRSCAGEVDRKIQRILVLFKQLSSAGIRAGLSHSTWTGLISSYTSSSALKVFIETLCPLEFWLWGGFHVFYLYKNYKTL